MTGMATQGPTALADDQTRVQWHLALWEQEFAGAYGERPRRMHVLPSRPSVTGTLPRDRRPAGGERSMHAPRLPPKRPWPTQRSPPARLT